MDSIKSFAVLQECETEQAWHDEFLRICQRYGFNKFLIAILPHRQLILEGTFIISNYPMCWQEIYFNAKLNSTDPSVRHCLRQSTPLIWGKDDFSEKQQRELYEESAQYGLRSGVTLPYHGTHGEIGILCFACPDHLDHEILRKSMQSLPALALLRDFAFESLMRFIHPPSNTGQPPRLTNREMECLRWCAMGKSSWDISQILHCSEAAVNFHFNNLRRKFDTTSRRQAVVMAIRFGLITP